MIRQRLRHPVTSKPADRQIDGRVTHQPPVMHNRLQKSRQHQTNRRLGVNPGPPMPSE